MAKTATAKKSIYGVHPGVLMTQKWVGELKQKTGRSLEAAKPRHELEF